MKINNDKYYTPIDLAIQLIEKTLNIIGKENIENIIEPSAGNGSFSNYLFDNYSNKYQIFAYDIEPEENRIIKQDFLNLNDLFLKKDKTLIIGNPPFGEKNHLALQFFKKSILLADFIAFILPISQLNNQNTFYQYELILSEDLNLINFSNRSLSCCFNIYKCDNVLKKQKILKIPNIKIIYKRDGKRWNEIDNNKIDITIKRWGSIGQIVSNDYSKTDVYKIIINKDNNMKSKIINIIKNYDWKNHKKHISIPYLTKTDIREVLLKYIPELINNKAMNFFKF